MRSNQFFSILYILSKGTLLLGWTMLSSLIDHLHIPHAKCNIHKKLRAADRLPGYKKK